MMARCVETVDIANVTFPDGWQRTAKERAYVLYETADVAALCRLYAMVSATSTGELDSDFDAEWKAAAVDSSSIRSATPSKARAIKEWLSSHERCQAVRQTDLDVPVVDCIVDDDHGTSARDRLRNDDTTATPPVKSGKGKQTSFSRHLTSTFENAQHFERCATQSRD